MRKGAGSRAPGLPFPCGGAQCTECFGGHSRALLQGRDPPAAHLSTGEHQLHVCHLASPAERKNDKLARLLN